eukprot:GHVT01043195.1.p1 GENE.GHVT01043195.1~~GHVT01043195.1.p1  ORF type:complete len:131 (-),score=28.17 GHVT01043195.1:744-1136(-)
MSSTRWLTTKQAVYHKLRYLVQAGCIFVGHGLQKDFRIINMFVPMAQVCDTVQLWRLPGQRLVSLKFLAAHLLKLQIQQGEHDSVEDAFAALKLYRLFEELKASGQSSRAIQQVYDFGYRSGWRTEALEE